MTVNAYFAYLNQSLITHLYLKMESFYLISHPSKKHEHIRTMLFSIVKIYFHHRFSLFLLLSSFGLWQKWGQASLFHDFPYGSERSREEQEGSVIFITLSHHQRVSERQRFLEGCKWGEEDRAWWNREELPSLERSRTCKKRVVLCKEK